MSTTSLVKPTGFLPFAFDDFFSPWTDRTSLERFFGRQSVPAANITENNQGFTIKVAAPGLTKDDFKIDLRDEYIVISSEKKSNSEEEENGYKRKEFSYNSFSRSFQLPDQIDKDKIEASYQDGILAISLPKKAVAENNATARQVSIK
ncbi:Hsp20/alpha crystallin family protein [Dyadobacter jiangsuensis]|uniref:HSP20 family protein n=1 Tax=Dyadobacter jiangsuensis TaxID=1591085 RepID=A0A2P8GCB2_9BACT|nr:Hsp20/alpha crystallin family protein [Dyadobacter jiangsuensis]PSL31609.1 HSP20 family protein [Dyadobacter jiangsuensis]